MPLPGAQAKLLMQLQAFTSLRLQAPVVQRQPAATVTTGSQQVLLPLVEQHQDAFTLPVGWLRSPI